MLKNEIAVKLNQANIDDVLALSLLVFQPSGEDIEKYHDKADWQSRLTHNGVIFSATKDKILCGYAICYEKEPDTFYIWHAGVHPEHRNQGVWKAMYADIMKYAKSKKYKRLTLNLSEMKFATMYAFVRKEKYNCYETQEITDSEGNTTVRSFFEKEI